MADTGWIKIYRSIRSNWLWENGNERYAKWWIDILMMVNHEPRKVLVNGKLIEIGVGERLTSIRKLSAQWGASTHTISKFLDLLVEDDMLEVKKSRTGGTTLKVRHYSVYQTFSSDTRAGSATQNASGSATQPAAGSAYKQELQEPKNEKKSSSSSTRKDVFQFWEQNGFGQLPPKTMQDLDYWVKDLQEIGSTEEQANQLLVKAMTVAIDSGVLRYNYVSGVLKNWESKRLASPEAVDAYEAKRVAQKQPARGGNRRPSPDITTEPTDDDLPF